MFNFLKRSEVYSWESNLLINIFKMLPNEYDIYIKQINDGLLRKVNFNSNVMANYIGFSYNKNVVHKYENVRLGVFSLEGILVFDIETKQYIDFNIHISDGLITGYSTPHSKKHRLDITKIDIGNLRKRFWTNSILKEVESILDADELKYISINDLYAICIGKNKYYHLFDLDDGDFIGIDTNKNVYAISHDPFEIKQIGTSILDILRSRK